ncbi:hypothetical protein Cs7R123_02550 [Catellatospora sp. TT07R-123]|uniref:sigma-70 family RNA polymerase sigma factor n=1 Tax=Catellatospora sp. TT07R-123 TaxID=2733863 RepID=UPI001B00CA65|nr:sigma-70 family RNA polymerase sigma factor [Catellatospora sp. TT07R-123]GHJ42913.1 hypothetical protein Cs7R123_02550 [Catellatospora sp. TT07R-123]
MPYGADDDSTTALALAARAGDVQAAEAFIAATQRDVIRFLAHLTGHTDAEDLAQETFLRAMRALPGFEGRASARTWLLAIARHVAIDHLRSLTRRPRTAELTDWAAAADGSRAAHGERFDEQVLINRLISQLDPDRREAFVATQVLGLSYLEAAEVIGCPVGTIRSRVSRAREDLAAALSARDTATHRHLRAV